MTLQNSLPEIEWRGEPVSRIILGTVQLGMAYGVANTHGQPEYQRACAIIEAAWQSGIRHFDTAQAYGTSEQVLGRALSDLGIAADARIVSKLALPKTPDEVRASIEATLQRLGVDQLWAMMFHYPRFLPEYDGPIGRILDEYKAAGRIRRLGVSLSPLVDAPQCLAHPAMDLLQLPCNAWDMRPVRTGIIETARNNGKLCCVRSVYLQGLLTMAPEAVAARLPQAEAVSRAWHRFAADMQVSPKELAVRFGMSLNTPLVIGAETPDQVVETVELARRGPLDDDTINKLAQELAPLLNDWIVEPWQWPKPGSDKPAGRGGVWPD